MLPRLIRPLAAVVAIAAISGATPSVAASPAPMEAALAHLAHEWARIMYQVTDEDAQTTQMLALAHQAKAAAARYPGRVEPLVWEGVIMSTEAKYASGFDALGYAKEARNLLEKAGRIDYRALDGAVPTTLGALYFMVPGFPLGFGDDDKARDYLEQAIRISPNGLDSNFFYGDFLYEQEDYAKAATVLKHALTAPVRPDRPVWDAGRRAEIRALLTKIGQKLASSD